MKLSFALLNVAFMVVSADAAECDRSLQPISTPRDLAYQDRGDRCEGLYQQPVATTGLRLVGFFAGISEVDASDDEPYLFVDAPGVKYLSVESLRRRQYYRMDAAFDGESFRYPLGLTQRPELGIAVDELAARVCIANCNSLLPVLVPARMASEKPHAERPYIVLQATEDLTYLRIEIVDAAGTVLYDEDVLRQSNWDAWRPVEIPLARFMSEGGELRFRATAQGRSVRQLDSIAAILKVGGQ